MNALEVKNLSKDFKNFRLNNITFSLPIGTIIGIIGENGSGKTTLIKALLNLVNSDSNKVLFWGLPLEENKEIKERIGVVFDEISFNELLNAEQLQLILKDAYKTWNSEFFNNYLKKYNIPTKTKIKDYSKGMKAKLQLGIALAHDSKLLILDEASGGLDPFMKDEIINILYDYIQNDQNSILLSSHDLNEIEQLCDYLLYISDGNQIFFLEKDKLLDDFLLIKCSKEEFDQIDSKDILAQSIGDLSVDVLVHNDESNKRKYRDYFIKKADLKEILSFIRKEKV